MANMAKKIDKEFVLSDSSLNCYGFRLMTEGYQLEEFKRNPVGYIMHDRDKGVAVKWDDLRVEGDRVIGKPVINMAYANAQLVIDSIENGFLNAASMGHIVALEVSDEAHLKLPGQEGPTVTRWYNRECSLVDIPGNSNALRLFDKNENEITLKQLSSLCALHDTNKRPMKAIQLPAAQLSALKLSADADEAAVIKAISDLAAQAGKVSRLETDLIGSQKELSDLKATHAKEAVDRILNDALSAKKCSVEMADKLKVKFTGDPAGLKDLVDTFQPYVALDKRTGNNNSKEYEMLAAKSFDELMNTGEMETVKAKYPDLYEEKRKSIKK